MTIRKPPANASIATDIDQTGKLHAPSAARNANDICAMLKSVAPNFGQALEIASGTGQHIVTFAAAMPDIHWHPTEVDSTRIASIVAYVDEANIKNITHPFLLNATQTGWSAGVTPKDLISLTNLLHLVSENETETLISEAAKTLTSNGRLVLYGPFKRNGQLISDGVENFDASIRASDPETGYKDDVWIKATAKKNGLILDQAIEMPANNLALIFSKGS